MHVLVTGASGFIGRHLVRSIRNHRVTAIGRTHVDEVDRFISVDVDSDTDYTGLLDGVDCIVHCAALIGCPGVDSSMQLKRFREFNVLATLNLARQAALSGVNRFVFLSSIKVNGERSLKDLIISSESAAAPEDAYAQSKYEAEQGLMKLSNEVGIEVVVVRAPLVYGFGVKGNMARLISLVEKNLPLPFARVNNKRSLVCVENLVSFLRVTLDHPSAAQQIFTVSDGKDLSTPDLLRMIAWGMNKKLIMLPLPLMVVRPALCLFGGKGLESRLCDSLQVDITKNSDLLGWSPVLSVEEGFSRMIRGKQKDD